MSNIRYSNNIFLGRYELDQLQDFVQDEGYQKYIRENAINFGLINNSIEGNFINGGVIEGVGDNTIRYNAIIGIDYDGKFFASDAVTTDIDVGTSGADTAWYWVKLVRGESNLETGTISVAADGVLTGSGTDFLSSLRGKVTDFPTKIIFPNSTLNTEEYEVLSVTDDVTATLNIANMSAESDLEWQIIPTNTPGSVLTTDEKKLFNYDSVVVTLEAESGLVDEDDVPLDGTGAKLPKAVQGEYWLARVQNSGVDVTVQDKRINYIFQTTSWFYSLDVERGANPLIGVEAVKYGAVTDPQAKNIVELAYGMRSDNWSFSPTLNRITFIGGEGGKFKDTTQFTDGDFDGWRLYFESGEFTRVRQSTLSGSQINLTLSSLDPAELINSSQQLLVVPDCSEVEIFLDGISSIPLQTVKETFPVNTDICRIETPVLDPNASYTVKYRYKNLKSFGEILTIPDDTVNGYFNESSFNSDGTLKAEPDRTRVTYTSGQITLTLSDDSYSKKIIDVQTDIENTIAKNVQLYYKEEGNRTNIGGMSVPSITALTSTTIAYLDATNEELRVYVFGQLSNAWSQQIGSNPFTISGISSPSITALTSTRIAFIDGSVEELRTYEYDGASWSQVGSGFTVSGVVNPRITAMTSTRVALIDESNEELRVYDFNGSVWALVGTPLSIPSITRPAITAITASKVAFADQDIEELRTYQFNGSTWSQIGNSYTLPASLFNIELSALNQDRVAMVYWDSVSGFVKLRHFDFNDIDWKEGYYITTTDGIVTSITDIAAVTTNRLAFVDDNDEELLTYSHIVDKNTPPTPAF